MFKDDANPAAKAATAAKYLADHANFSSHARHIPRDELRAQGFKVDDLEADPEIQDWVLTAFHTATLTLQKTVSMKLIQNHLGVSHPI
jgi:hypothetical protein